MRTKTKYLSGLLAILFLCLTPLFTFAQEAATNIATNSPAIGDPVVESPSDAFKVLLMALIPALSTLTVVFLKKLIPKLPKWTLPVICSLAGAAVDWISTIAGGPNLNPMIAIALGGAGVALREFIDQATKTMKGSVTTLILFAFGSLALFNTAATCHGPVQVKEGSDPVIVKAEWMAENALNIFDNFFAWEASSNTAADVKKFADSLRSPERNVPGRAEMAIVNLRTATEVYKANKTGPNADKVTALTSGLLSLVNETLKNQGLPAIKLPERTPSPGELMNATNPAPVIPI